MKAATGTILITKEEVNARIAEIGRQISSDYAGREILFVGILKGSFVFLSDLIRAIRSEEHTSELQSHVNLVCRLLLEKKKRNITFNSRGARSAPAAVSGRV